MSAEKRKADLSISPEESLKIPRYLKPDCVYTLKTVFTCSLSEKKNNQRANEDDMCFI